MLYAALELTRGIRQFRLKVAGGQSFDFLTALRGGRVSKDRLIGTRAHVAGGQLKT